MMKTRMLKNKTYTFNTEYVSQNADFKTLPYGYIDKTVCGCGATSVAIENDEDAVIAVPNIALVTNKAEQYPNERCKWNVLGVWGDTEQDAVWAYTARCGKCHQPIKIMVTYDSIWRVEHLLGRCRLIIDESDQILHKSKLKAQSKKDKDMDVYTYLMRVAERHKDTVTFISATPIPLDYMPEWVSTLQQIKFEFSSTVTIKPMTMQRTHPIQALQQEIIRPLEKDGAVTIGDRTIEKVIVFINSVQNINKTVQECLLNPEDVAILCADSAQNDYKIKGYNRLQDPARLPKYTFVTSSGFQGIDLYDDKAISIVVGSTKAEHQMVDLLTDLKQATSRQRLKGNPNYDRFIFIYNQTHFEKSEEEVLQMIDAEQSQVTDYCQLLNEELATGDKKYANVVKGFKKLSIFQQYTNFIDNKWCINETLFARDRHFILNVRRQYEKGFTTAINLPSTPIVIPAPKNHDPFSYKTLLEKYKESLRNPEITFTEEEQAQENYQIIDQYWHQFHNFVTNSTYAKKRLTASDDWNRTVIDIRHILEVKSYDWVKELKPILTKIYNQYNVKRSARIKDLHEFGIDYSTKKVTGRDYVVITKI